MNTHAGSLFVERLDLLRELSTKLERGLNSEDVRKLRVLTRRLRAHLWLLRKVSSHADTKTARRQLKQLGKVLGRYRTYDVAAQDASDYKLPVKHILKEKEKAAEKVRKELTASKQQILLQSLRQIHEQTKGIKDRAYFPILQRLHKQVLKLKKQTHPSRPELHRIRIRVKKIRYLLEILGGQVEGLKAAQTSLGKLHDLQVLTQLEGSTHKIKSAEEKATKKARRVLKNSLAQTKIEISRLL